MWQSTVDCALFGGEGEREGVAEGKAKETPRTLGLSREWWWCEEEKGEVVLG